MRCYYEILGVSKDVELSDLKKAYYKMSLQWHPDKNAGDDTTETFQQIQEAYRVLSDPHERAWYDSHRTQILQGGGHGTQMGGATYYDKECVDVFQYFTRACFQGFDDGEKGFYTVYRKVFETIATEEASAAAFNENDGQRSGSEEDSSSEGPKHPGSSCSYPSFGLMNSEYSTIVAPFYQFWEAFRTRKNYSWLDKYDTRFADSRQVRRAMETENDRIRNAARKKRNEEIRELVAYVKKRDKRVAMERERVQLASQEAKARIQIATKIAKQRDAVLLTEAWEEELSFGGLAAQWAKDLETELTRLDAEFDGAPIHSRGEVVEEQSTEYPEMSDSDELYCVACDKLFNSVKAKVNHEFSKKHKKQAEMLRQILLADDETVPDGEMAHPTESKDEQTGDIIHNGLSTQALGEVKLTKRAKKAQRRRLNEAQKLNSTQPEESVEPIPEEPHVPILLDPIPKCSSREPRKSTADKTLSCSMCGVHFPSRNQLFAHLKESGHAIAKETQKKSKQKR